MDRFFSNWAPSAANFTTHTKVTFTLKCTSKVITKEATKEPIHAVTPINQPRCSQTAKTKFHYLRSRGAIRSATA
jgi:hypothetical protein